MNSFIQLNDNDNVVIALRNLIAGEVLQIGDTAVVLKADISFGHKAAIKPIAQHAKVIKYGLPIGSATINITPGQHVHTHNLSSDYNPH